MTNTRWREPAQITQGDTISFTRQLGLYPASAGWSLLYAMRGNGQAIEFTSTADGDDHKILVAAAITETWLPAEYQLEGWAVQADGTRRQIYLNSFTVTDDLATAPPDQDTRTFCQKMLESVEAQLLLLAQNSLQRTSVEQTEIDRVRRLDLMTQREKLFHERQGEVAAENARNGRPTGRKIKTVLAVMPPGFTGVRQFGAGNSVFNCDVP